MCFDCHAGCTFYCQKCSESTHRPYCASSHRIDIVDDITGGFSPAPPLPRFLELTTCPKCTQSFKDGGVEWLPSRFFDITLCTLTSGCSLATVKPGQCQACSEIIGDEAWQYLAVPGGKRLWFTEDVVRVLGSARDASVFKFSEQAAARTLRELNFSRGSKDETRRIEDGLRNAQRYSYTGIPF